jgi:CheY-like chemotaxis protein
LARIERELAVFERADLASERTAAVAACEHEAHSLNGAAATLHLAALAALAEELELTCLSLAATGETERLVTSARELLTRIEAQFAAIEADEAAPVTPTRAAVSAQRTVLQVEDNPVNARLIERALGRRPEVRLVTATRAETGLRLAHDEQPDLILVDLHLPDASGEEFLGRLRRDPVTQDLAVVVTTADACAPKSESLRRLGVHEYLTKPVDIGRLLELVDELA